MKQLTGLFIILFVIVFVMVQFSPAEDWSQWRGQNRDGVWNETGIIEKFDAPEIPIRWTVPIGSGYSGPSVADGRVYITDRLTKLIVERFRSVFRCRQNRSMPWCCDQILSISHARKGLPKTSIVRLFPMSKKNSNTIAPNVGLSAFTRHTGLSQPH